MDSLSSLRHGLWVVLALVGCGESPTPSTGQPGSAGNGTSPSGTAGSSSGTTAGNGTSPSAGQNSSGGNAMAGNGAGGATAISGSGGALAGAAALPDTSGEIYDPAKLPRFDLELPAASVAALKQDPDTYVTGSLKYGDEVVSNIGVRIKGEGSLRTLDEKAAFKLKFDEFVPKQSFHSLRRMTLNNMVEDPSFLAERLAFHFFRAQKLPAPRCNSALVYVNGQFFGVYANVEAEDKTFLRRWFADDGGNLYEEGQVDFTPGNETAFDLETNEEANDRSDLVALIGAVSNAKPASYMTDVGAQLDMTHFLAFTAAEAAVNQWDMYAYTVFYPNNFRIYRDPTTQKFTMLPWGMDMSMKPFRDSGKPHIDVQAVARQGDSQNGKITAGLMFRSCLTSPGCKAAYLEVVNETADAYAAANLEALAKQYFAQIEAEIAKDTRKEYTAAQVKAGYDSLLKTIRERPAALRESAME
ncbi:MAG TPA: CotH kinase family protein [Polyangiaceae bacterium]|nr:CotH kinase family protein [Polyangiaceae bacterium]